MQSSHIVGNREAVLAEGHDLGSHLQEQLDWMRSILLQVFTLHLRVPLRCKRPLVHHLGTQLKLDRPFLIGDDDVHASVAGLTGILEVVGVGEGCQALKDALLQPTQVVLGLEDGTAAADVLHA